MKKLFLFAAMFSLFFGCQTDKKNETNETQEANKTETVQEEIPQVAIADFDTKAADYVGKKIKVKGIVDHICKHGGKKLFLVGDSADLHVESDSRFDESPCRK